MTGCLPCLSTPTSHLPQHCGSPTPNVGNHPMLLPLCSLHHHHPLSAKLSFKSCWTLTLQEHLHMPADVKPGSGSTSGQIKVLVSPALKWGCRKDTEDLSQRFLTFLAPGTSFMEGNFSMDGSVRWFWDDSSAVGFVLRWESNAHDTDLTRDRAYAVMQAIGSGYTYRWSFVCLLSSCCVA